MTLLVGTEAGLFALDPDPHLVTEGSIRHVAAKDGGWWAITKDGAVIRNSSEVARSGRRLNCLLPAAGELWIGAEEASLLRLTDGELTEDREFRAAPGRATWHTPWGGPPDVRSMCVDQAGSVFVNVHVGGILRHEPGGWSPTLDIDSDVHQVAAHPDRPGVVVAATAWGLAVSTDGARTWDFRRDGLHASYCRAAVAFGDTIYVSASTGPGGQRAVLYRGALAGGELERCANGLPEWFSSNLDTHCLAVVGERVFAADGTTLYSSDDTGHTWLIAAELASRVTSLTAL